MTWPKVRLREVLKQRKEFINIDDLSIYKRPRVQLHAHGIVLRDEVEGAQIKTKTQQVCRAGEFLVAEIDAKVGGYGIIPDSLHGALVSSHYFLFAINENTLDRRFLDFYIRTALFFDQVTAQGSTNYAAIRPSHVLEYEIPLPPLPEQRRIVARIEALAGRIQEAQNLRREAIALHMHKNNSLMKIWDSRHESKNGKESARKEFTFGNVIKTLKSENANLAEKTSKIYEQLIDLGAHPNPAIIMLSREQQKIESGRIIGQKYLTDDSRVIVLAMKETTMAGIVCLAIFNEMFKERFAIVGINDYLLRAKKIWKKC